MHRLIFVLFLFVFFALTPRADAHWTPASPHGHPHPTVYDYDGDGVTDAEDCDPNDPAVSQLAYDAYGDGVDSNCDGADGTDPDGDGYPVELDCNERNSSIYPDATEIPGNGIDEDCDGMDWAG